MRKQEITRKLDEIIDFSGVERYIDTPVKRYSSGMYVRLAFAVAAHLESEILIVDEVLAVGDAEFQKKCLGKMGDISKGEGRTVLFVSHNMGAVKNLCNTGIHLQNGMVNIVGAITDVISEYQVVAPFVTGNAVARRANIVTSTGTTNTTANVVSFAPLGSISESATVYVNQTILQSNIWEQFGTTLQNSTTAGAQFIRAEPSYTP
jgi:ABC-type multidrug transport system ATPase subunit